MKGPIALVFLTVLQLNAQIKWWFKSDEDKIQHIRTLCVSNRVYAVPEIDMRLFNSVAKRQGWDIYEIVTCKFENIIYESEQKNGCYGSDKKLSKLFEEATRKGKKFSKISFYRVKSELLSMDREEEQVFLHVLYDRIPNVNKYRQNFNDDADFLSYDYVFKLAKLNYRWQEIDGGKGFPDWFPTPVRIFKVKEFSAPKY